jgi:hypothetical protein
VGERRRVAAPAAARKGSETVGGRKNSAPDRTARRYIHRERGGDVQRDHGEDTPKRDQGRLVLPWTSACKRHELCVECIIFGVATPRALDAGTCTHDVDVDGPVADLTVARSEYPLQGVTAFYGAGSGCRWVSPAAQSGQLQRLPLAPGAWRLESSDQPAVFIRKPRVKRTSCRHSSSRTHPYARHDSLCMGMGRRMVE